MGTTLDQYGNFELFDFTLKYIQTLAYNADGLVEYMGLAIPNSDKAKPVWQIRKFIYSGTSVTDVLFAQGTNTFTQIWNNYGGLSYS